MKNRYSFLVAGLFTLAALGAPPAQADMTIFDVQLGLYPEATVVQFDGVVVTAVGYFGFFVQEPTPDPTWGRQYSGIWIFTNHNHTVHKGDLVNVSGRYMEYFDFSEVETPGFGTYSVVGTAPVPSPVSVTISEVNDTGLYAEAYESVLIRVDRLDSSLYSYAPNAFGEWYLRTQSNATGDSLLVDQYSAQQGDDFEYDVPDPGSLLTFAQGVLVFNFSQYKLAPRSCETDLGIGCKPNIRGAYATGPDQVNVQFGVDVEEASAEDPMNYELASGIAVTAAVRDPDLHRIVHLTTGAQPNGSPEQVIVSNVRSEQGVLMDANQTFDFRSGITPIYNIQHVVNPQNNDVSPLFEEVVTVQGRVTALDGNYYYIQDGDGLSWRGLYSRVAKSGDMRIRDEVRIAGLVTEYFGSTQLVHQGGVDYFVNLGQSAQPVVTSTVLVQSIPYRGSLKIAEPYEDCLIKVINATIQDSIPGTPGPYFGEWLIRQVSSPISPDTAGIDLRGITTVSYDPCPGNRVDVTGILLYDFSQYRIAPRTGRGGDIREIYAAPGCPTAGLDAGEIAVAALDLEQNRPNPFTVETTVRFALSSASQVSLEVVDVGGRLVKVLASGPMAAGAHDFSWDGTNDAGHPVASGTYFCRLQSNGQEVSRRMVLME